MPTKAAKTKFFLDLQLALPSSLPTSIQTLLDDYFAPEQLTGDDQYFCEQCEAKCDAERHTALKTAPSNLILTIKHFEFKQNTCTREKLLRKIHYNDLVVLTSNDGFIRWKYQYELYAAVVHRGSSADSGHYYTYAQRTVNLENLWFNFDDREVNICSLDDINNLDALDTPYVLFYRLAKKEHALSGDDISELIWHANLSNVCEKPLKQATWHDLSHELQMFVHVVNGDKFQNPPNLDSADRDDYEQSLKFWMMSWLKSKPKVKLAKNRKLNFKRSKKESPASIEHVQVRMDPPTTLDRGTCAVVNIRKYLAAIVAEMKADVCSNFLLLYLY